MHSENRLSTQTLKMEALCSSEMSITIYQSTSCHTWQYLNLQKHHYQNLKSCNKTLIYSDFLGHVTVQSSRQTPHFRGTLYLHQHQSDRWRCLQAIQITCHGLWMHCIKGGEWEDAESNDKQWIMRNCPLFCSNCRDESENTKLFAAKQGDGEVTALSSKGISSIP